MNRIKNTFFAFVLFSLFLCVHADAQRFLYVVYHGNKIFVQLPEEGRYLEFEQLAAQEIPVGRFEADDANETDLSLEVRLFISAVGDWNLRFYRGNALKAYLYFSVDHGQALFKGMWIRPGLRSKGLSKLLFKYHVLFCDHFGLGLATANIYKPLMARVLMGMGFVPNTRAHRVLILNGQGREIHVYPVGFELETHLIESQHMRVLQALPEAASYFEVFINTTFFLPPDETIRRQFWENQDRLGGRFYLYQALPPQVINSTLPDAIPQEANLPRPSLPDEHPLLRAPAGWWSQ